MVVGCHCHVVWGCMESLLFDCCSFTDLCNYAFVLFIYTLELVICY